MWIKVEDELPEIDREVLIYHLDDERPSITYGYLRENSTWADMTYDSGYDYGTLDRVSHWMPLPELP